MKYAAFISYRHNERDSFIAENLQHELEHYRIPSKIRKSSGRDKVGRVFRDREELPISNNLEDNIQEALEGSEYLIVICSPESKASEWVQREVDTFIKLHDKKHVLAVLAKDEPADSFPEILCYDDEETEDENGNKINTRKNIEPLAAEMRAQSHRDILKEMKVEKLRLLAPILGCSFDDLKQREKEYRTKRIIAVMGVALAAVGVFSIYAVRQNRLLAQQYKAKQINESKYLANVSGDLLDSGDRMKAAGVALEALPENTEDPDRPIVNEAVYALNNSLYSYRCESSVNYAADRTFEMDYGAADFWSGSVTVSPSGNLMAAEDVNGSLYIYDLKNNKKISCARLDELDPDAVQKSHNKGVHGYAFISDEKMILDFGEEIICYNPSANKVIWKTAVSDDLGHSLTTKAAVSDDGTKAALFDGISLIILDADSGKITSGKRFKDASDLSFDGQSCTALSFSPSGKSLVYTLQRYSIGMDSEMQPAVGIVDTATGDVTNPDTGCADAQAAVFDGEDKVDIISYETDKSMDVMSMNTSYAIIQIDAQSGKTLWSTPADKANINANTRCGLMFCNMSDGNKLCGYISNKDFIIDPDTGNIEESSIASADIEGISGYDDRMLFLGTKDGKIYMDNLTRNGSLYEMGSISYDKVSCFAYSASTDKVIQMKGETDQIVISVPKLDKNYKKAGDFDASTVGYTGKYRYADHEPYGDDKSAAELVLWKTGSTDKCVDIKAENGEYFVGCNVVAGENGDTLYYTTGKIVGTPDTLHAYSISSSKETGSLQLTKEENIAGWSSEDWGSDDGRLLLNNSSEFEVIDLASMKIVTSSSKESGLQSAALSNDGTEVILFVTSDNGSTYDVKVWDTATGKIRAADSGEKADAWKITSAGDSGLPSYCVGCADDTVLFYSDNSLHLADLKKMQITDTIPFSADSYCKFAFIGNDDQLLMWGDDKHLKMWNVSENKLVMEDPDTFQNISSIMTDSSTEHFGILETEYSVNVLHNYALHIYTIADDGRFSRYADLGEEAASFDNEEVFACVNGKMIFYPFYTTQQLIDRADKVIGEDKLTELDKQKYFVGD